MPKQMPKIIYADKEGEQIACKIKIGNQYYSGYLPKSFRNQK